MNSPLTGGDPFRIPRVSFSRANLMAPVLGVRALLGVVIDRSRDRFAGDLHGFMQFYCGTSDSLARDETRASGRWKS